MQHTHNMKLLKMLNAKDEFVNKASLNQSLPHDRDNRGRGVFLALDCCMPSTGAILRRHVVWPETKKREYVI